MAGGPTEGGSSDSAGPWGWPGADNVLACFPREVGEWGKRRRVKGEGRRRWGVGRFERLEGKDGERGRKEMGDAKEGDGGREERR